MLNVIDSAKKDTTSGKMVNWYVLSFAILGTDSRDGSIMDW